MSAEPTDEPVADNVVPLPNLGLVWGDLNTVEMKSIRFADKPLWQHGAFHLVCGCKGAGKGTLLALLAARVTRGELGPKRRVIWVAAGEDSYAMDVRPRIQAAGGNVDLVRYLEHGRIRLPDHVPAIHEEALRLGDVGLIVIDPVSGALPGGKSSNSDTDVRDAIAPLNDLADELDTILAGVRHIGKDRSRGILSSVLGSVEWVNVPRVVLVVAADDEEDGVHHVQVAAGNRIRKGSSGRTFRIDGVMLPGIEEEVTLATEIGTSGKDVEALLANQLPGKRRVSSAALQELILRELETGEKIRTYIDTAAKDDLGANPDSVYKYGLDPLRKDGKIKPRKDGIVGGWYWSADQ